LKKLGKDSSTEISPVLDRDTGGMPGTPSISDEIFNKIVFSDVFVADVTLTRRTAEWRIFGFTITHRSRVRRSPNPNVLLELGFAIAHIGWERIILVQNAEYGGPDELPFDLRGRRTVTYHLSPDDDDIKSRSERNLQNNSKSLFAPLCYRLTRVGKNRVGGNHDGGASGMPVSLRAAMAEPS
jgi:hypothetical protein